MDDGPGAIRIFHTVPHVCGYLPDRRAINAVVDPALALDTRLYSRLAALGFRRSGSRVYRPACQACDACVPLRIPVAEFRPDRSQRRTWRHNRDVTVSITEPGFIAEHFALYSHYLTTRHADGGMGVSQAEDYLAFLVCDGIETRFLDFRLDGRCVALAVVDVLEDALSAVYTFFEPALARRSPGVLAILHEIELARQLGKDWLYLGYWIGECRKMRYKSRYLPHELLVDGRWLRTGGG